MRENKKRRRSTAASAREGPRRRSAHTAERKRRRLSRAGRTVMLAMLLLVLLAGMGAAVWCFLPVGEVVVSGKTRYQRQEILAASGIASGDRLFGVDKLRTARSLEAKLPYISGVSVSWRLPNTLVLRLRQAAAFAAVARTGGFAVVDEAGKVLQNVQNLQSFPNLPTVTGPNAGTRTPGQTLDSAGKSSLGTAASLLDTLSAAGIRQVTAVDVHDKYQITFSYQGRISVLAGTSADLETKLKFAAYMLTKELTTADKGSLDVSRTDQNNQAVFTPAG